jgi:ATP-dependent helicase Lhr and Lhr-like helicase
MHPSLHDFHPAVARWFTKTYGEPTPPQAKGWPLIGAGKNVLLLAPTGSGKTLAAFLKCLDWLYQEEEAGSSGVRVLYISPLKALNNDIHRNLELPLQGIAAMGREMGLLLPELKTAVRTGDTPGRERQQMVRRPPQILITTPESLFLLISSQARQMLKTVRFVIVDEIHSLFSTKRGAHLALSLERLQHLVGEGHPLQRIGLSATMRPLDQVAAYLAGNEYLCQKGIFQPRPVTIMDTGQRKTLDLKILLPLPDLRELPEKSIWPPIYRQLLDLVKAHRTTLIFVNNRRSAERITANINQLAETEIARTHHGSVSKEVRFEVEEMLKRGEISCIVATASLELGIDIGHIDLVVQIESPKEVARGLQRVGRAGHIVGMPSKGRIIPKTRADLLEAAAILREMKAGNVEPVKAVHNCLDVLAQQLVAITAEGEWPTDAAFQLVRCAYNFQTLSAQDFENILAMLAGTFQTTEYVDLRPRLFWDRQSGMIKPDSYGKRLVYSSGGTIPDRGYYGVYLRGSNVRLGELDEEFVYERRLNERFVLGTSVWKIEELRQDRVIVSLSKKGGEAMIPFWKADLGGRSFELGKRIGAFMAEIEARLNSPELMDWLKTECDLEPEVARNLCEYLIAQKKSIDYLPTDRRIVIEEFPDEVGEWRIFLHSPFGMKLHSALGLLIKDHWEGNLQIKVEFVPTDSGVMFQLPGLNNPPILDWSQLPFEDLELKLAQMVSGSALFGIAFRHAAQLSMVMPRTGYGRKRTPFWLTRLKAGNLLQVVAKYPDFPLVIETYRAVLQDYFELGALREVLTGLRQGKITVHRQRHQAPSPFAASHLLTFVDNFMYEGEAPKSELKLSLFGLGREALKAIVGDGGFRKMFDLDIVKAISEKASGKALLERNLSLEAVERWLERVGDTYQNELGRIFPDSYQQVTEFLKMLIGQGKALVLAVQQGKELIVLHREISTYLSALPDLRIAMDPVPKSRLAINEARRSLIQRYSRTHGPFRLFDIVKRYGFPEQEIAAELALLAAQGLLEAGEFTPGITGEEWCDSGLLQEIHRRSLAQARREVEPCQPDQFGRFLAHWQGIGSERTGVDGLAATLNQLSGLWLPALVWESSVLPNRVQDYHPGQLDQLITSGQFVWQAKGNENNLQICFENTALLDQALAASNKRSNEIELLSPNAKNIYRLLENGGALSLPQLWQQAKLSSVATWQALEDLIRGGIVTNDTLGPVRYLLLTRPQDRLGVRGILPPSIIARMGRWSLLPLVENTDSEEQTRKLLSRYGLLSRELADSDGQKWQDYWPILDLWEQIGKLKRGYFVSGLSGIQYALPSAVEQLRLPVTEAFPGYWALHWSDPANPVRIFPEWPESDGNSKPIGDYVVFKSGNPVLFVSGKKLKMKSRLEISATEFGKAFQKLIDILCRVTPDQKIVVTHYNGEPVQTTEIMQLLETLGFEKGYQESTLWPTNRVNLKPNFKE